MIRVVTVPSRSVFRRGLREVMTSALIIGALTSVGLAPALGWPVQLDASSHPTASSVKDRITSMSPSQEKDHVAPVVRSLKVQRPGSPPRVDTSQADAVITIRLHVTDRDSGVSDVLVMITLPNESTITSEAVRVSGNDSDGWYSASVRLLARSPRGSNVISVEVRDRAGNSRSLRRASGTEFMQGKRVIGPREITQVGQGDSRVPRITGVTISDTVINTEAGPANVTVTASVDDADAGLSGVDITVSGPDCLSCFVTVPAGTGSSDGAREGTFERVISFPGGTTTGTYRISITARDRVGNDVTLASHGIGQFRRGAAKIGPSSISQNGRGLVIEGYAVRLAGDRIVGPATSVAPGEEIGLALSTLTQPAADVDLRITDATGRVMTTLADVHVPSQAALPTPWLTGQGFDVTARFTIPADWPSGVYFIRDDPALFFIVRPRARDLIAASESHERSDALGILIPTNTANAYSLTSGMSLYSPGLTVVDVSFLRYQNQIRQEQWLPVAGVLAGKAATQGRQVVFLSDVDLEDPSYLNTVSTLAILGHSEYWTGPARAHVDAFVDRGGDLIVVSGNSLWWQARYSGANRERLTVIKWPAEDPLEGTTRAALHWQTLDPQVSAVRTVGADFTRGGYGLTRRPNAAGWMGYLICEHDHPLLAGTGLRFGDMLPLARATEYDGPPILGFDPRGCPVADVEAAGVKAMEILGFDIGERGGRVTPLVTTIGAITLMRRSETSGSVVNFGTFDVGSTLDRGDDPQFARAGRQIRTMLNNALDLLASDTLPIDSQSASTVVTPFVTPSVTPLPADFYWLVHRPALDQNPRFTGTG